MGIGFCLIGGIAAVVLSAPAQRFEASQIQMGVEFKIVLYAADEATAQQAFQAAFTRIAQLDKVMSDYDPDSELSRLCRQSPTSQPVHVSDDLWRVLRRAQSLSHDSQGAFDVTVGPLTRLWRRARRRHEMPDAQMLADARAAIGYDAIQLDNDLQSVSLLKDNMRLDLGGIAKGDAADQALLALQELGIRRALIDASGDITVGDPPPGKPGWAIGVAPLSRDGKPSQLLELANCAVATSGDAWQFVEIDGKRYSHIVDPRTGLGLTDHSSVTIIAQTGIQADSLASAVSVLGPIDGIPLIERTCGASAFIVRSSGVATEFHRSSRFPGALRTR